jgi:anti-sigma factor RsiW
MISWRISVESNIVRPHVPEEELHAYCDGELSAPQRVEIAEHLLGCLICRSQHAEVEELRARTATLLAMAAPRSLRHAGVASITSRRAVQPWRRYGAIAAMAIVGSGLWFTVRPDRSTAGTGQYAGSLSTPSISNGAPSAASLHTRAAVLANRTTVTPHLSLDTAAPSSTSLTRAKIDLVDVDPVVASEWPASNWDAAVLAGNGTLDRVGGLSVASVRVRASVNGGRPTFMIRQQLADGRPVWVFEGPEADVTSVNQVLQASGIAMSMPHRSRPDYVTADGQLVRTQRMVTVVGHLPVDSLNVLASKLQVK